MIPLKFVAGGQAYCFDEKNERQVDEFLVSSIKSDDLNRANHMIISQNFEEQETIPKPAIRLQSI
jgi:hypothetical protein